MRAFLTAILAGLVCQPWTATLGATLAEEFSTDPVGNNRFEQRTLGTESSFTFDPANRNLLAVLDVDRDEAWYLSAPFPALTEASNISFSFEFKVLTINTQVTLPSGFIGLMTTNPVTDNGDGLSLVITGQPGRPAVAAAVDEGPRNSGGQSIQLETNVTYLAIGQYAAANRRFSVGIYHGPNFTNLLGTSTTYATNGFGFKVDRMGLQNKGREVYDYTDGFITLRVDNFFLPARPPVFISVTNTSVRELDVGTNHAVFTVSLSSVSGHPVQLDYATANLSAIAGQDYAATSGTLLFPPGTTSPLTIRVPVFGDTLAEPDETFVLLFSNPANAVLTRSQSTAIIINDDLSVVSIGDAIVTEPPNGATQAVFTVSLSKSNSQPVSITYVTVNGTAGAPGDYASTSGVLVLTNGATSGTIRVSVNGDAIDEFDETFWVSLIDSSPTNAVLEDVALGLGTIINRSPPPVVVGFCTPSIAVAEGNAGQTAARFTLCLSNRSEKTITVCYATGNGTAVSGCDYGSTYGTVTFSPGVTNATVQVNIVGDTIREPDETFYLRLTCATNATLGVSEASCRIVNDDPLPCIYVDEVVLGEGSFGTRQALFHVWLSNPSVSNVTVQFATTNSTAIAGEDYVAANGTITFLGLGQSCSVPTASISQTVPVTILSDSKNELDERFCLRLDNPENGLLCITQACCTITNDDFVCVSINDTDVVEGNSGFVNAVFTLTLDSPSLQQVQVSYRTQDGSARAGDNDYVPVTNTVTVAVGATTRTITVPVRGDMIDEPNETFGLLLTGAVNARVCDSTGTATILDDDPPSISVSNIVVGEGHSGNFPQAVFTLRLTSASSNAVSVQYFTANGSAIAGQDYFATNGIVTFPAGQISTNIRVTVIGDDLVELHENFYLRLTNPIGATLSVTEATCTITNDDPVPCLLLPSNIVMTEGTCTNIPIGLSRSSTLPVTIQCCLSGTTGGAYLPCRSTCCSLVILPGATNGSMALCFPDNAVDQTNQVFELVFSVPDGSAANCSGTRTRVVVLDNDRPALFVENETIVEGDVGTKTACLKVRFSTPPTSNVTAQLYASGGTARPGLDYVLNATNVVLYAGLATQYVCLEVVGDLIFEANETVTLCLTNVVGANVSNACATATIFDNDPKPRVSIADSVVWEGNAGTTSAVFAVSVQGPTALDISLNYQAISGSAAAGVDFVATSGKLTILAGVTNANVTVPVIGDTLDEPDETFSVRLFVTDPTQVVGVRTNATGTILDDDAPEIRISRPVVSEPETGTTNLTFDLTLSNAKSREVRADWFTRDGTAQAGSDYLGTNGSIIFAPSQTATQITLLVYSDSVPELEEDLFLCLTNLVFGWTANTCAEGRILSEPPCVKAEDIIVAEGGTAIVPVRLSYAALLPVTVDYATVNGTALAGSDYTPVAGSLTFTNGTTNQTVLIPIPSDGVAEQTEDLYLRLFNAANATICTPMTRVSITDSTNVFFTITNQCVSVVEGDSGVQRVYVWGSLSPASAQTVMIPASTCDGTATVADADYRGTNGVFRFLPGVTNISFPLDVYGDRVFEPDEFFFLNLSNPPGVLLNTTQVCVNIINDDPTPTLYFRSNVVTVKESDLQNTPATFELLLSNPSAFLTTVDFGTSDGTAKAGSDYVTVNGPCKFPPGNTYQTITVPVIGDFADEPVETFYLNLTNPNPNLVVLATNRATGEILNDDGITVRIDPVTVFEPLSQSLFARFVLTLSKPPSSQRQIGFFTADGTATAGLDYVPKNGVVTFSNSVTTASVYVEVLSDSLDEPTETFFVMLTNGVNFALETNRAVCTIHDTDWPCISIDDTNVIDRGEGTMPAVSTLRLSSTTNVLVTVICVTSNGTALAGSDYIHATNTARFLPETLTTTITNWVHTNTREETNEFFRIILSDPSPSAVLLCDGEGLVTILNTNVVNQCPLVRLVQPPSNACLTIPTNVSLHAEALDSDGVLLKVEFLANGTVIGVVSNLTAGVTNHTVNWNARTSGVYDLVTVAEDNANCRQTSSPVRVTLREPASLQIGSAAVVEGNSGTTNAVFTVSLLSPSCDTVTVQLITIDDTATASNDYSAVFTNLTFTPGAVSASVIVPISGDTNIESDERVFVLLTNAVNASILTNLGIGIITNDDFNVPPVATIMTPANGARFTSCDNVTITVVAQDANDVVQSIDFLANGLSLLVVSNNASRVTNVFNWVHPTAGEYDLTAVATDSFGAQSNSATVHIRVDPPPTPQLQIDDVKIVEGNTGTNSAVFTVSLSPPTCIPVTVEVVTSNGTAMAGSDYLGLASHVLTFGAGETSKPVPVPILGDLLFESDEDFFVHLLNPTNASVTRTQGIGTILNDDDPPTISISDAQVTEGDSESVNAVFTLSLSTPSGQPVTVDYYTADGTAVAGSDYVGLPLSPLAFATNQVSTTIVVSVIGDYQQEVPQFESFYVILTNHSPNVTMAKGTGVGTIRDNDLPCSLSATPLVDQTSCSCDAMFQTVASGTGPFHYSWMADGRALPGQTNSTLLISSLRSPRSGLYSVVVSNSCLTVTQSARLFIQKRGVFANEFVNPMSVSNGTAIQIPDLARAAPYPSEIIVSCAPEPLRNLTVTLHGLNHLYPDDLDILLVGPNGMGLKLMSDCGGGGSPATALVDAEIIFSDAAGGLMIDVGPISSGMYRPTDCDGISAVPGEPDDSWPLAPLTGFFTNLAGFDGIDPNGVWSLWIVDDFHGDVGSVAGGWSLSIEWDDSPTWLELPQPLANGRWQVVLHGASMSTCLLQGSHDLEVWTTMATAVLGNAPFTLVDVDAQRFNYRFYRAIRCPMWQHAGMNSALPERHPASHSNDSVP